MAALGMLLLAALATCACAATNVTVVRVQLSMEQEHTITVDSSIEYILEFVPNEEQSLWPSRLRVTSGGGDTTRPVLLTARQRTGAQTWQLPYTWGELLLFELERTLCPDDTADLTDDPACAESADAVASRGRGRFSLHVSSSCAARVEVRVLAAPARDWLLPFHLPVPVPVRTSRTAPRVMHYRWASAEQTSVRLVAASEDDVCATLAVYNYTCPVPGSQQQVLGGTRLTMQRSGALQVLRRQYPRGFYVVALVEPQRATCEGERAPDARADWLWEAAVPRGGAGLDPPPAPAPAPADKRLTLTVQPALTVRQYVVAASVTMALFLSFYVAFGALVVVQRWEPVAKFVKPKAVLADTPRAENGLRTEADGSPTRRRRDSTATFDSSDNSDSDEEPDTTATTSPTTITSTTATATAATTAATPAPATVAVGGVTTELESESDAAHTARVHETFENGQLDRNGPQPGRAAAEQTGGGAGAGADTQRQRQRQRPFGLPARLHVAALSRRRARTIRARSDRYLHTLYTVAVFYALPVVQFVAAFQIVLNVSGSLDLCYYNFLCAHRAGALSDFNHVFSNIGYLLLGALFLLQLRRRRARRDRKPRHEEYGIPAHYGLLESLGAGMMVVALLSASYHVCPNQLNFQFDTAFMYVLAVLGMVKIYQSRHPDVNARAHATFGVLAVLIALVVWGVLGGGALFWGLWTVLHVFTFLLLSLRIYYVGQFRLDKQWVEATRRDLRAGARPLYSARLVLLLIANAVNWGFAIYGLLTMAADFAGHMLSLLLANTLMYMVFYLTMKLLHGERLRWYAWGFLAGAAATWAPALRFFVYGSSDWAATPAQSRHSNHECKLLHFYDSHDLWHMLSAVALYLSFNAMLTWDDGLSAVKRDEIAVF